MSKVTLKYLHFNTLFPNGQGFPSDQYLQNSVFNFTFNVP